MNLSLILVGVVIEKKNRSIKKTKVGGGKYPKVEMKMLCTSKGEENLCSVYVKEWGFFKRKVNTGFSM